jgi:hypothetical protein
MGTMGWSSTAMAKRYQHITDPILKDVAKRVDGLIWKPAEDPAHASGGYRRPVRRWRSGRPVAA